MNFKTSTKEKFSVITLLEPDIPANMTGELGNMLQSFTGLPVPHLVLNMEQVQNISPEIAVCISDAQQNSYEKDASLVVCALQPAVEKIFSDLDLLDSLNFTPTESEAWDILQMEEIERELMNDLGEESSEA